jgi:signal transduction histidine kinase
MICHELRNPLNGIYNNADLLKESLNEIKETLTAMTTADNLILLQRVLEELDENMEAVQAIMMCARHQKLIADDVLNMSRLDMNVITVHEVDFEPNTVMTSVVRMFEAEMSKKAIKFKVKLGDDYRKAQPFRFTGDPGRLAQVICNLINNAIKVCNLGLHFFFPTVQKIRLLTHNLILVHGARKGPTSGACGQLD